MSHRATNWAIQQRGLKPATKLVLWYLSDRHHPDHGCFPSQETLAHDCEMSRSSLNNHLNELERLGLIKRVQRSDKATRRQKSTLYMLGFEIKKTANSSANCAAETGAKPCTKSGHGAVSKKGPKPCPKMSQSRVQNLDTIPVREPVKNLRARNGSHYFTADERFEARQIADHIGSGGGIAVDRVCDRVKQCLVSERMINKDQAIELGLAENWRSNKPET